MEKKDIQTTNFSVRPKYQHFKDGQPPQIIGYQVVNSLRITVRNLEKLGAVLDKVVTLGSNKIDNINFYIDESAELFDEARKLAIARAGVGYSASWTLR